MFNSVEALQILKKVDRNIPFILVTGTVSDHYAVQAMRLGAFDYILKDRLQRLPAAILGAMERVRMEQLHQEIRGRIIESEKQYFDLIQHLPAAIYTCDIQGRVLLYNNAAFELWGRGPTTSKEAWCGSTIMLNKYGNEICPAASPMARAVAEGRSIFGEEMIVVRPDGSRRHVLSHPSPNFNSAGDIIGGTNMLIDITDRKKTEVEMLMLVDNLRARNKELAQFGHIVSHHLRAPIARILGLASIFNNNPEEDAFIMKKVREATVELDEVVKDINLVVSARTPEQEKYEYVDFESKLRVVSKVLDNEIKESEALISFNFSACEGMVTIPSTLYSIFNTLLSNAIKFRVSSRCLQIHVKSERADGLVRISVEDNGRGIDLQKHSADLFTMYKRFHKDEVSGKGIGLHLLKIKVDALGGNIEVRSVVNQGTEVLIYLPETHEN
jgi:PAS domain S-box-containing protein